MLVFMLHVKLACIKFILSCDVVIGNVIAFVREVVGFCLSYNIIVGNVLLFVLEVSQAYGRYLLH